MKRVLVVAYDINPSLGSEAGVAYLWVKAIAKKFDVTIITQNKHQKDIEKVRQGNFSALYMSGSRNIYIVLRKLKLYNLDYAIFNISVKKHLKLNRDKYDLVHYLTPAGIHSFNNNFKDCEIPYIVGPVGGYISLPDGFQEYSDFQMKIKEFYYKNIIKNNSWQLYFSNALTIIAGTPLVARFFPESCKAKTEFIYDAVVDTEFFKRSVDNQNSETVRIVYSGKIESYKGCHIIFDAFKQLIKDGINGIKLIYIGEGSEMRKLQQNVVNSELQGFVEFHGRVSKEEVRNILCMADIFCLPTLKEPGGCAILEAMSCGLPVITSRYGGPLYSVIDGTGILIDPISVNQYSAVLVAELKKLIQNKDVRTLLGSRARNHIIENYSFDALNTKIMNLYERIS